MGGAEVGRRCRVITIREREEVCRGEVGRGCTGAPYKRERGGVQGRGGGVDKSGKWRCVGVGIGR